MSQNKTSFFDDEPSSPFWKELEQKELEKIEKQTKNIYPIDFEEITTTVSYADTQIKKCKHKGNLFVFQTKDLKVFGGGYSRDCFNIPQGLTIDCAGWMMPRATRYIGITCSRLNKFLASKKKEPQTQFVCIPWPDGGIIDWTKEMWIAFLEDLQADAQRQNKRLNVLVCCMGGHGRTGTALTIMAGLLNLIPKQEDPIEWIRRVYCHEAVETKSQMKYIDTILNYNPQKGTYNE